MHTASSRCGCRDFRRLISSYVTAPPRPIGGEPKLSAVFRFRIGDASRHRGSRLRRGDAAGNGGWILFAPVLTSSAAGRRLGRGSQCRHQSSPSHRPCGAGLVSLLADTSGSVDLWFWETTITSWQLCRACLPGSTVTLNAQDYMSSSSDPMRGSGRMDFRKVSVGMSQGFGNFIPRDGSHFSIQG